MSSLKAEVTAAIWNEGRASSGQTNRRVFPGPVHQSSAFRDLRSRLPPDFEISIA